MNRNMLIVLAGGFLIAVLVALLVQAALSGSRKEPEVAVAPAEVKTVEIAVARRDIRRGEDLGTETVRWQRWPEDGTFPGAVVRKDDESISSALDGRILQPVKEGDPIIRSLITAQRTGALATTLARGMRAFTINVNSASMVGGFVGPGDYVDIMLTYRERINYEGADGEDYSLLINKNIRSFATETILENIRVLAVDQTYERESGKEDVARTGRTVTLEVDRTAAEKLAMAGQLGDLSLALRALGDDEILGVIGPVTTDARTTRVFHEVIEEISRAEDSAGKNARIVRIYKGDNVQDIQVYP